MRWGVGGQGGQIRHVRKEVGDDDVGSGVIRVNRRILCYGSLCFDQ